LIRFKDTLRQNPFTLTADLALGRGMDADGVRTQARLLGPVFDALQVPDSHDGRLQMSGQAAAALLLSEGVDPVVHVTGRDRNRIALENDLLGLAVLGVSSILLTRGEELSSSYKPVTRQVFELSGEDLITTAHLMGEDESIPGAPGFLIGTAATVFNPKESWKPRSLLARVDAGAGFIQKLCRLNHSTGDVCIGAALFGVLGKIYKLVTEGAFLGVCLDGVLFKRDLGDNILFTE